jgi:hypothetical protein
VIQSPACGAQNPDYACECASGSTDLARPDLAGAAAELRDQLLGMGLGAKDLNTICFALNVDWHQFYDLRDQPEEQFTRLRIRRDSDTRGGRRGIGQR